MFQPSTRMDSQRNPAEFGGGENENSADQGGQWLRRYVEEMPMSCHVSRSPKVSMLDLLAMSIKNSVAMPNGSPTMLRVTRGRNPLPFQINPSRSKQSKEKSARGAISQTVAIIMISRCRLADWITAFGRVKMSRKVDWGSGARMAFKTRP
jgi:hypothetical protein